MAIIVLFMAIFVYLKKNQIFASSNIYGDIYSGGTTQNVSLEANSVVAGGAISGTSGSAGNIFSNYKATALSTTDLANLQSSITRLISERAVRNTSRCDQIKNGIVKFATNNPEGEVLYCTNDLTITSAMNFSGKGTIIAEGDISINANIQPTNAGDVIGFISKTGNITVGASATNIAGAAFYANGNITIQ